MSRPQQVAAVRRQDALPAPLPVELHRDPHHQGATFQPAVGADRCRRLCPHGVLLHRKAAATETAGDGRLEDGAPAPGRTEVLPSRTKVTSMLTWYSAIWPFASLPAGP